MNGPNDVRGTARYTRGDESSDVYFKAREALLAAIDTRPGYWWRAGEVCAVAGYDGPVAMYLLCRMANPEYESTLELDSRLRLRRRELLR